MVYMEEIPVQKFNIRYFILVGILLIFSNLTFHIQYRSSEALTGADISCIPLKIGDWQGKDISIGEKTKDILETDSVLMRTYVNSDGKELLLAIVYYKDSRVALHLPESCGLGQGSRIIERTKEKIILGGEYDFYANKLLFKSDKKSEVMLYYFETGNIRTSSYKTLRLNMMINKLRSKSNSGALIRFSASIKDDSNKTTEMLKQFIKEISPLLPEHLI